MGADVNSTTNKTMTQERFLEIRDTYTMEQWTMLSDEDFAAFSNLCSAEDNRIYLERFGHIRRKEDVQDGRPLRVIKGVSDNGRG